MMCGQCLQKVSLEPEDDVETEAEALNHFYCAIAGEVDLVWPIIESFIRQEEATEVSFDSNIVVGKGRCANTGAPSQPAICTSL